MACWFFADDNTENIDIKIRRFRDVFEIENGFRLNTEQINFDETKNLVLWSWNNLGEFPDILHYYSKEQNIHIVLDGYISGFGKFGAAGGSQLDNAKKLIQLYVEKKEFIPEINGSFCIIIYNPNTDQLIFYNDRISSRPIWYNKAGQRFCAANFPSVIAAIKRSKPEISETGLWSFLATGRHTGETGLFEGIDNLPGGSLLFVNANVELLKKPWFDLQYTLNYKLTNREWGERIAGELKDSAQRIKNQYQNTTLFLSGGMDSRVAAGSFGDGIHSVTLTTTGNMNSRLSEKVARACNIHHETVYRDDDWYLKSFEQAALIGGGNYKLSHAHFTSLFQRDDKYFKYTFTHGDLLENFNQHYFKQAVNDSDPRSVINIFNRVYSYSVNDFDKLEHLFLDDYGKRVRLKWEEYAIAGIEKMRSVSEHHEDVLDAYFRWQNTTVCPTYLMLENIRPFAGLANLMFDNKLLSTLLSIPHEIKGAGVLHSEILKNLNPRLRWVPNSNYWLPPVTPDPVLQFAKKIRPYIGNIRRKVTRKSLKKKNSPLILTEGSWDMLHERYRKDEAYKSEINSLVTRENTLNFNPAYVNNLLKNFNDGNIGLIKEVEHIYSVNKLLSMLNY